MPSNSSLWQRIQGFDLDVTGDEYPFSARLGRENGWSHEETVAAIEEYKRFIYLICVSPSPLTPSEVVDQVWHLHLLYTRSYWTGLCEGVLGRPVHHEPTKGGAVQAYHFLDQYADTRSFYESEFECAPPAEFWPLVSERFAAAPSLQRTERKSSWVAPQPNGLGSILWCMAAALLVVLASCGGLAAEDQPHRVSSSSVAPMLALAVVVALAWLVARGLRRTRKVDAVKHSRVGGLGGVRGSSGGGYWGCSG